jgi:nucleoid DNA-binding protein
VKSKRVTHQRILNEVAEYTKYDIGHVARVVDTTFEFANILLNEFPKRKHLFLPPFGTFLVSEKRARGSIKKVISTVRHYRTTGNKKKEEYYIALLKRLWRQYRIRMETKHLDCKVVGGKGIKKPEVSYSLDEPPKIEYYSGKHGTRDEYEKIIAEKREERLRQVLQNTE